MELSKPNVGAQAPNDAMDTGTVTLESNDQPPTAKEICYTHAILAKQEKIIRQRIEHLNGLIDIEEEDPEVRSQPLLEDLYQQKKTCQAELDKILGEMNFISPCPLKNCQKHHSKSTIKNLRKRMAESCSLTENKAASPSAVSQTRAPKAQRVIDANCFQKPTKTAKKAVTNENNNVNLTTSNSFNALGAIDPNMADADIPPTPPKIQPVMLRLTQNYNIIIQAINREFPNSACKLSGQYIKVSPNSEDDHRGITTLLTNLKAEYYVIQPLNNRPLKICVKGLPVHADVEDIKEDLISKGIKVEKVVQLKQLKTKFPLPIFMVEIRRGDDALEIYKVQSIMHIIVKIVPFKKKQGTTQCYNCNYFHHSSHNCRMNARCLKCGENHRTGECTIKERLENPLCINCNSNHMASWQGCPLFPKKKPAKGQSTQKTENRNLPPTRPVTAGVTFANICSNETTQEMAPQIAQMSAEAKHQFEPATAPITTPQPGNFNFITAIAELQNLFNKFPKIFEALNNMSKVTSDFDKLNIFISGVVATPPTSNN